MVPPSQGLLVSSPLRKLKGNQPLLKKPAVHLAHLEEEDAGDDEDPESDDPSGIEGVTKEFMVHLARAVKDAQADEKYCYHCSSLEHFICNCALVKTSRDKETVKWEGGDGINEGSLDPSNNDKCHKEPPRQRLLRCKKHSADSLLESGPLSAMVWDQKHS